MWRPLGRAALIVAKAVSYKLLGKEPTDDFIQLIKDLRQPVPPRGQTAKEAQRTAAATAACVSVGGDSADLRAAVEFSLENLQNAEADLPLNELEDQTVNPEEAAHAILDAVGRQMDQMKKSGFYLLWLEPPLIEKACYVHFYWEWQQDRQVTAYTIRDFYHRRMYFGKRASTPALAGWWERADEWENRSALEIWDKALRRARCSGLFNSGVSTKENWKQWQETLKEMTDSLAPGAK